MKDKNKLASLCEFPFYCSPCIDNATTVNKNDQVTIKVTKKLFYEVAYKEFFEKPLRNKVEEYKSFKTSIFNPSFDDKKNPSGFMFSYNIVEPSKKWEGLQGFIYLRKINDKYKITGIDTVP